MFDETYKGRKALITGHTGFKGSWLSHWLLALGAEVHGYALDPAPDAVLFEQLKLADRLAGEHRGDLADLEQMTAVMEKLKPDFVFHLAAQSLVRESYMRPVETFSTNVLGTVHVMEAARRSGARCVAIMVTTDKCYENREWLSAYREEDAMGGHDPYSASKGAAEIAISAYRRSFFPFDESPVLLASARAGNVVGGGDWAKDRIVPDCFRALQQGKPIPVRNKTATRPWQHVLEPLSGYLSLAAALYQSRSSGGHSSRELAQAYNFGPALRSNRAVADVVQELIKHAGGEWTDASDPAAVHEASKLNLATDKAFHLLGWRPVWDFEKTIELTARWYLDASRGAPAAGLCDAQIFAYESDARLQGIRWAN